MENSHTNNSTTSESHLEYLNLISSLFMDQKCDTKYAILHRNQRMKRSKALSRRKPTFEYLWPLPYQEMISEIGSSLLLHDSKYLSGICNGISFSCISSSESGDNYDDDDKDDYKDDDDDDDKDDDYKDDKDDKESLIEENSSKDDYEKKDDSFDEENDPSLDDEKFSDQSDFNVGRLIVGNPVLKDALSSLLRKMEKNNYESEFQDEKDSLSDQDLLSIREEDYATLSVLLSQRLQSLMDAIMEHKYNGKKKRGKSKSKSHILSWKDIHKIACEYNSANRESPFTVEALSSTFDSINDML